MKINNKNYVICYVNSNGDNNFEITTNITKWQNNHPYDNIHYIFEEKMDLQSRNNEIEWCFMQWATNYGFQPNMLHGLFTNKDGHLCEILGMNPSNRKYKFIIKDQTQNKRYKVTADYIKNSWPFSKTLAPTKDN